MHRPQAARGFFPTAGLAGVLVLCFAVLTDSRFAGAEVARYADDLATAASALFATVLCARAALRHSGRTRAFWWLFAGASGAWAIGELIWGLYDLVLGSVPVPSPADVAYLAAIPLAATALLFHPAMSARAGGRLRSLLDGLVIAAALFLLAWTLILQPLRHTFDLHTVGGLVTAAYPLGDVVIVFLVVLVIRGTTSGDKLDLWCLLGGLLVITSSDVGFGYLTQVKDYATGNAIDTGWFAGYLAIAVGARFARSAARSQRTSDAPALTSAAVVGPFIPLLGALSLVAIRIELGHPLGGVATAALLILVAFFLLRQVVLLIDLSRGGDDDEEAHVTERLLLRLGQVSLAPPAKSPRSLPPTTP